jgi:RNA polymerase sigma factor for flagellar operon FliA
MLLVADVLPIVDAVVAQMSRHLPQHVSTQDLASAGKLALMEILNDFDGSFAQDRGYVICRVRGAVMDEMRRLDPLSRYGRKQVRRVQKAVATLEIKLSRGPTDAEVAVESGLPEAEVRKISQLGIAAEAQSTDAPDHGSENVRSIADPDALSPAVLAEKSDSASAIRAALKRLSSSQSAVLQHYYFNGLTLQEIAVVLGLSVVRVHQLRAAAEARLRGDMDVLDAWIGLRRNQVPDSGVPAK